MWLGSMEVGVWRWECGGESVEVRVWRWGVWRYECGGESVEVRVWRWECGGECGGGRL